jgi:cell division protein FtsB
VKRGAHAAGGKPSAEEPSRQGGGKPSVKGAPGRPAELTRAPRVIVGAGRATASERGVRPSTGGARRANTGPRNPRPPIAARVVWGCLATAVLIAVLGLFVFPTRTYLDQRRQLAAATRNVQTLNSQNDALQQRADQLHTDAEIERLAREQYHLVKPGEKAFALLPAPTPTTTPPPPHVAGHVAHPGLWKGMWDRLTSWR